MTAAALRDKVSYNGGEAVVVGKTTVNKRLSYDLMLLPSREIKHDIEEDMITAVIEQRFWQGEPRKEGERH